MTSTEQRAKELAKALQVAESGSDLELQILAAALAACAREAAGECGDILLANCSNVIESKYHISNGVREAYEEIRALERAVGEKAT